MPKKHIVRPGECLASIAEKYGFLSWRTIYDHSANQDFRKLRSNPHVLSPGDVLTIPDPPGSNGFAVKVPTGRTEEVVVERESTLLRLRVLEHLEGENCEAQYELEIEGLSEKKTGCLRDLGKDKDLEILIPAQARRAWLTLKSNPNGEVLDVIELHIGNLTPVSTPSGVRERLRRVGFDPGPEPEPWRDPRKDELGPQAESALRAFQARFSLEEAEARGKLVELAGV
ncbi:MAG: hypothetical protein A2W26_12320 [Acidobacteria bacterium RBG_16_64_8]|nr:MAG: hypothetical protein A2W26_12320 [Acidobacteria bacterium RBG_16_64_8]